MYRVYWSRTVPHDSSREYLVVVAVDDDVVEAVAAINHGKSPNIRLCAKRCLGKQALERVYLRLLLALTFPLIPPYPLSFLRSPHCSPLRARKTISVSNPRSQHRFLRVFCDTQRSVDIFRTRPNMPPRGSEGYDFTPILTHYLFLFTTILALVRY